MEEESGMSLSDVFKVILKKIWWVVGAMAVCVLIFVLVVELWYNKRTEYYSVSYELIYPDSDSGKYPDGSTFIISDSVSVAALEKIVESDENLAGIDVAKMVYNDKLTVESSYTQQAGGDVKKTYTLTANARFFKDEKQAAIFLRAVASYPINRVKSAVSDKDYRPYVSVYDEAKTYEDRINALLAQKRYLQEEYGKLIASDQSAASKLASLDNVFTSTQRQILEDTITAKYYVLDTENFEKTMSVRKEAIEKQITDNNAIIEEVKEVRKGAVNKPDQGDGQDIIVNPYDTEIARLTVENAQLKNEKNRLDETCAKIAEYTDETNAAYAEKQAFDELFAKYRNDLIAATDVLKAESVRIYSANSDVIYASNSIKLSGGMSAIITAVLGALVGLVLASLIICLIDMPKYKKAKYGAAQPAEKSETADGEESATEE